MMKNAMKMRITNTEWYQDEYREVKICSDNRLDGIVSRRRSKGNECVGWTVHELEPEQRTNKTTAASRESP
jgi:hypothetical protein